MELLFLCTLSHRRLQELKCWECDLHIFLLPAAAKSLQSCLTLCDPIDGSPPGSPVPGILQARTLEWVAISFSSAWKWTVKEKSLSRVWLLATPWTAAYQAPLSMGFFQARVLEWVAISFSRGSSWPRNWTRVSRIVGRRFTVRATREVLLCPEAWAEFILKHACVL